MEPRYTASADTNRFYIEILKRNKINDSVTIHRSQTTE